jgi:hypothetical protein
MQTPSIGRAAQANSARRKPAASASATSDFARHVGTIPTPAIEQTRELPAMAALAAILDVQEINTDESRRGAAKRYGSDLLDRLAELRMEILDGRVSPSRLAVLGEALRDGRQRCGDAGLDTILEELELRVEVEIAKLTVPRQARSLAGQSAGSGAFCE